MRRNWLANIVPVKYTLPPRLLQLYYDYYYQVILEQVDCVRWGGGGYDITPFTFISKPICMYIYIILFYFPLLCCKNWRKCECISIYLAIYIFFWGKFTSFKRQKSLIIPSYLFSLKFSLNLWICWLVGYIM